MVRVTCICPAGQTTQWDQKDSTVTVTLPISGQWKTRIIPGSGNQQYEGLMKKLFLLFAVGISCCPGLAGFSIYARAEYSQLMSVTDSNCWKRGGVPSNGCSIHYDQFVIKNADTPSKGHRKPELTDWQRPSMLSRAISRCQVGSPSHSKIQRYNLKFRDSSATGNCIFCLKEIKRSLFNDKGEDRECISHNSLVKMRIDPPLIAIETK